MNDIEKVIILVLVIIVIWALFAGAARNNAVAAPGYNGGGVYNPTYGGEAVHNIQQAYGPIQGNMREGMSNVSQYARIGRNRKQLGGANSYRDQWQVPYEAGAGCSCGDVLWNYMSPNQRLLSSGGGLSCGGLTNNSANSPAATPASMSNYGN